MDSASSQSRWSIRSPRFAIGALTVESSVLLICVVPWLLCMTLNCGVTRQYQCVQSAELGAALRSSTSLMLVTCKPHSFVSRDSHHQRPARLSSPGRMARVHGSQPMLG